MPDLSSINYINDHQHAVHWLFSFSRELLISAIGGFVGGALAYGWYIERKEVRKNLAAKQSVCTKALLTTQMSLLFQMQELKDLQNICKNILNFELDKTKLSELLKNSDAKAIFNIMEMLGRNEKSHEVFRSTQFIIIKPSINHLIQMPHDIFDMKELALDEKIVTKQEIDRYFQGLANCNRDYVNVIAMLERNQETKDVVFDQLIITPEVEPLVRKYDSRKIKFLSMIVGVGKISSDILIKIEPLLKKMEYLFSETEKYIRAIGIAESLELENH